MNISQLDGTFNGKIFVPTNIKDNKQVIIGKCDKRNIFYIFIGLVILGINVLILKTTTNNIGLGIAIGLLFGTPFFIISFIKLKGLNIEDFILVLRANKLSTSAVRINDNDNIYKVILTKKQKEIKKNKKNKKANKNDDLVDTDDNLIKIQNKKQKQKKEKRTYTSSLIYN